MLAHQAGELFFALLIGYTFRATPRNVLFQRVQAQVAELAERLLPQITTVEIGPEVLGEGGGELQAWRQDLQLASANVPPLDARAEPPPRFLVVNPGDSSWSANLNQEVEMTPATSSRGPAASPGVADGAPTTAGAASAGK